jgi:hypothetical protein
MKRLLVITIVIAGGIAALAQQQFPKSVIERTGGFLERPSKTKGRVVFVNTQKTVAIDELAPVAAQLSRTLHVKVELVPGAPVSIEKAKALFSSFQDAKAAIFIVENAEYQDPVLVSPEGRWAIVNVAPLSADKAKPPYIAARTRKEMARAFSMLCGAFDSTYSDSLMGTVSKPTELDAFTDFMPPMDIAGRVRKYLVKIGVPTQSLVSYRTACKEGWAPPPTNDFQKAVWDNVHALPTEPIKIKPETQKQDK